jgi:hypothetical protein
MITDNQVRKLMKSLQQGKTLEVSAAKSDMDVKTARKYRDLGRLPSELQAERIRTWRTRKWLHLSAWQYLHHIFASTLSLNNPVTNIVNSA